MVGRTQPLPYPLRVTDPLDLEWIARNPAYRRPSTVWQLRADYDRAEVMRNVVALSPKPPRPTQAALRPQSIHGIDSLANLVRHLVIDGYDRPLRRWAIERMERSMNVLYFAGGLIAAAIVTWIAGKCNSGGAADTLSALAIVHLGAASLALLYASVGILRVVVASAYARSWIQHMPRSNAAPRYWRMYG